MLTAKLRWTSLRSAPVLCGLSLGALALGPAAPVRAQTPAGAPSSDTSTRQPGTVPLDTAPVGWNRGGGAPKVPPPPPRDMTAQERAIVDRATARRQLLEKGEYSAAYEFLSPSSKAFKSLAEFQAEALASTLRDVVATRAECDKDNRCSVTLTGKARLRQPKVGDLRVPVSLQEIWLAQSSGEAQLILR